jgi:hypothetical protein
METLNDSLKLLQDLSINDGIQVMLSAVRAWADYLVPLSESTVCAEVKQYVKANRNAYYHPDIEKWHPKRFWEELIGDFHLRMENKGPIKEAKRPEIMPNRQRISQDELEYRATILANMARDMPIANALNFFENTVVQWSLVCPEEWFGQEHSGYIFHLLAQATEH